MRFFVLKILTKFVNKSGIFNRIFFFLLYIIYNIIKTTDKLPQNSGFALSDKLQKLVYAPADKSPKNQNLAAAQRKGAFVFSSCSDGFFVLNERLWVGVKPSSAFA